MCTEETMKILSDVVKEWSMKDYTNLPHSDRGLCSNLLEIGNDHDPRLFDVIARLLNRGWNEWEHFSGNDWYPVSGSEEGGMYSKRERWGDDRESAMRRDLSKWMSSYILENWLDICDDIEVV